ncbi:MAG: hypothetical protein ABF242_10945 [Flavobacteriales bacterium]
MRYLILIIFVFNLVGCATVHNTSITPPKDFGKGNEISTSGAISFTGFNGSIAYSPINNIFIHGLVNRYGSKTYDFHHAYQFGIGGYFNFKRFNLEAEIGYGNGNFEWKNFGNSGALNTLEEVNGTYKQFYGSFSSTFDNIFGVTLRFGKVDSEYSYIENPFGFQYLANTPYQNIYAGALFFLKKETEVGITLFATYSFDIYSGKGIITKHPYILGLGIKYNLNFSKKV